MSLVGFLVGEQDEAFNGRAAAIEHHLDRVAHFHGGLAVDYRKLLRRNQAFNLPANVDDDILLVDAQDATLQDLPVTGRKMARVVIQKRLILGSFSGARHVQLIVC